MSELIKGIDISNNNGNIDFDKVKADGIEYVYMKATEGSTYKDKYAQGFYNECKRLGLKVGFYHFLTLGSNGSKQAEEFYNTVKSIAGSLEAIDLELCLDVELDGENLSNVINSFVAKWKQLTNRSLLIYTYTYFINSKLTVDDLGLFDKVWVANYNYVEPENFCHVYNSKLNVANCEIVGHQFTDKGRVNGVNGNVDVNKFSTSVLACDKKPVQGEWQLDNVGWWFKYSEPIDGMTYPKNKWEYVKTGNNSSEYGWYYFDNQGYMEVKWVYWKGNWYFLGDIDDGQMKTGWFYDKDYNRWFYSNSDGEMQTGWIEDSGHWYYLYEDSTDKHVRGEMATGWIEDKGKTYLLYSNGEMASNCCLYGYKFDKDGVGQKID